MPLGKNNEHFLLVFYFSSLTLRSDGMHEFGKENGKKKLFLRFETSTSKFSLFCHAYIKREENVFYLHSSTGNLQKHSKTHLRSPIFESIQCFMAV